MTRPPKDRWLFSSLRRNHRSPVAPVAAPKLTVVPLARPPRAATFGGRPDCANEELSGISEIWDPVTFVQFDEAFIESMHNHVVIVLAGLEDGSSEKCL